MTASFNYVYVTLDKLLDKYIEMQELVDVYLSQNEGEATFDISIGERRFYLVVKICKKQ